MFCVCCVQFLRPLRTVDFRIFFFFSAFRLFGFSLVHSRSTYVSNVQTALHLNGLNPHQASPPQPPPTTLTPHTSHRILHTAYRISQIHHCQNETKSPHHTHRPRGSNSKPPHSADVSETNSAISRTCYVPSIHPIPSHPSIHHHRAHPYGNPTHDPLSSYPIRISVQANSLQFPFFTRNLPLTRSIYLLYYYHYHNHRHRHRHHHQSPISHNYIT